jgi:histidinol-phosphatase (PHP family)
MLKMNYHTHTDFCDGRDAPEEVVLEALRFGMKALGFSGHMDPDIRMDLPAYKKEIQRLREKYRGQIDILMGVELDNLSDPSWSEGMEYVIGSTHFLDVESEIPMSVDNSPEIFERLCREFFGGDYYRLSKAYYELEAKVCDRIPCTFVGHFDLVTRFNDQMRVIDETDRRYYMPALEAMEYLVSRGMPFEINCGAVNRGRKKELYPNTFLLKKLHEFGGEIFISSDAHQKELLLGEFDLAVETALACGFTHTSILVHGDDGKIVRKQLPLDELQERYPKEF